MPSSQNGHDPQQYSQAAAAAAAAAATTMQSHGGGGDKAAIQAAAQQGLMTNMMAAAPLQPPHSLPLGMPQQQQMQSPNGRPPTGAAPFTNLQHQRYNGNMPAKHHQHPGPGWYYQQNGALAKAYSTDGIPNSNEPVKAPYNNHNGGHARRDGRRRRSSNSTGGSSGGNGNSYEFGGSGNCGLGAGAPNDLAGHGVKALPRALEIARDEGRKPMLDDAYGSVMEVAMDQYGSRFLQQQLGFAETHEADNVAHEVLSCGGYGSLVRDVFGNYAAQKLLERVSTDNRQRLTSELHGNVVDLALHMYGCRVIQKALDVVSEHEAVELASELEHDVLTCVRDQNGNHVVQKCLERCPLDCVNFMADALTQHVRELARHPYGCRVLQRLLENRPVGFDLGALTVSLVDEAHPLAVDQYGNYVAQHLLEHGSPGERSIVASVVVDDVVHLSQQKFASNVVERCLETCTQEELNNVLAQLVTKPTDFEEPLITLMKDQFGNFVAQKLLDVCNSEQRERLLATMRVHLSVLRRWNYARHIVQRVERLLEAPLQDTSQPMGQTYYKDISNDLDYASRRVSM